MSSMELGACWRVCPESSTHLSTQGSIFEGAGMNWPTLLQCLFGTRILKRFHNSSQAIEHMRYLRAAQGSIEERKRVHSWGCKQS